MNASFKLLAVAAAMVTSGSVAAEPATYHVNVQYEDLNLASPIGQRTLNQRVDAAVGEICGIPAGSVTNLWWSREAAHCRRVATDQAMTVVAMKTGTAYASR